MFYYADTCDSAYRKPFKYDATTALADTTPLSHLRKNDQYNEGFDQCWLFTRGSQSVHIWTL